MAHKSKVSNKFKDKFLKELDKEKRKINFKNLRKYFIVVCEGTKTEPNYFESFRNLLPVNTIQLKIIGARDNTINIVDIANELSLQIKESVGIECESWAVFDKDSFREDDFDNAIHRGLAVGVNCAYSNEAFELWYILHFNYHQHAASRKDYEGILTTQLGTEYKKNDPNMYLILKQKGSQENAIKWSIKLLENHSGITPSSANPSTTVYKLVEALNKYIPEN